MNKEAWCFYGNSHLLSDVFEIEYFNIFKQYFLLSQDDKPLFRAVNGQAIQTRPLCLRDMDKSDKIVNFLQNCDKINEMLDTKSKLNKQPMSFVLKRLHASLRMKIKNT